MDNFNKIIKQKVEQFEVPYDDAHWAEMEGKLNSIRATKIKNTIFGSAAALAVIAISAYLIFPSNEEITIENTVASNNNTEVLKEENNVVSTPKNVSADNNNGVIENQVGEKLPLEKNEIVLVEENEIENSDVILNEKTTELATEEPFSTTKIEPLKVPNAEFIVYNNRACLGEGVSFESQENDYPVSYTWNFGDGTISHKANPTHIYKESLVYTVTLTLLNRQTGIEYTTIQQDVVTVLPLPKIAFTYMEQSKKQDDNALKYPYTHFNVKNVDKKSTYQWTFGNGESLAGSKTKTIYENPGSFVVKLVATNSYGCENSTKKRVSIKNGATLYVQTGFSPDDDGRNDEFIPKALIEWDVQFEMTILDKSGKLVYKTSDKNEPWNGKLNNTGKLMNPGIYLWQIVTYDAEGTPHRHSGNINIVK